MCMNIEELILHCKAQVICDFIICYILTCRFTREEDNEMAARGGTRTSNKNCLKTCGRIQGTESGAAWSST